MLAYLKQKTTNKELYETNLLEQLKQRNTKFSKLQYWLSYAFLECVVRIKYYANIITVKQICNSYLFILPFDLSREPNSQKKLSKCMQKVEILMKKYKVYTLVLSEDLKQTQEFQNLKLPVERKVTVLDGSGLMPYLLKEILEYVVEKQERKMQLEDLYICVKETKNIYIENICYLAHYFKTVNIITPNIKRFQKQADRIEEKQNLFVTVTNNKKKSLSKSRLIVNLDFSSEELKKYTIYRRAIIIWVEESKMYENSGFEGVQIKQVGIDTSSSVKEFFSKYDLLEKCSLEALYESLINKKQGLVGVKQQMQKDQIKIRKLYGRKGEIGDGEYKNIAS